MSLLANCRSQFLLDRLWKCLKLFVSTDSTSWHGFASQFGLEMYYTRKTIAKIDSHASFYWTRQRSAITVGCHCLIEQRYPERWFVCACVCVCVCGRAWCVCNIYDNNIWLRVIIIKIISLYLYWTGTTCDTSYAQVQPHFGLSDITNRRHHADFVCRFPSKHIFRPPYNNIFNRRIYAATNY